MLAISPWRRLTPTPTTFSRTVPSVICEATADAVSDALSTTSVLGLSNCVAMPEKVPPSTHEAPLAELSAPADSGPSLIWKAFSVVPVCGRTCTATSRKLMPAECVNCNPYREPKSTSMGAALTLANLLSVSPTSLAHAKRAPRVTADWWLSSSVTRPSDETSSIPGWSLAKLTRESMSIHDLYALLTRLARASPLASVSRTCVVTDAPASRAFLSTLGTVHETALTVSSCSFRTLSAELTVVYDPKLAVIVDVPADTARMRVLLADERDTTDGADEERLVRAVTSNVSDEPVRCATTLAVAWK